MSEQENIKAAAAFFEAWNAGDLSRDSAYSADDFMAEVPGAPGPLNREQATMYNQNFLTAFPGSKFEVLRTISQGDYVVMHWKISGKNTGALQTPSGGVVPPTGRTGTVVGSTTSQLRDGKVIHTWTFWDMASLLNQLGLLPPM
jgi:steroid delta-isomerase-like uncharacterized protein